jgi:UDP-N-acetylmuramate: L-alanyl-gamma-D-glutamyl-meso-diaminopimelate ligase
MKHIHFIGICGVAMSALATAFHKQGWNVTGSDVGFFPPISDYLERNNIAFYPGWHVEKMMETGAPDLIVVGNVAGSNNPEFLFVQKNNLNYKSYPEVIAEHIVQKNSVVCAGTYGKTSTTVLLTLILKNAGLDPTYMFGGLSLDLPYSAKIKDHTNESAKIVSAPAEIDMGWSVLEGDEYKTARWDNRPKFALYSPTHLLLTAATWDHADIYPTEENYLQAFKDLVAMIPESGLIVAKVDKNIDKTLVNKVGKTRIVTYGTEKNATYVYSSLEQTKAGIRFKITNQNQEYVIHSLILGEHMAENICGAFAMAKEIGIETNIILKTIAEFNGIKRRLEKRYEGNLTIYDDLAHSPSKAQATLKTLRSIYPNSKIICVFEPNTGNRKPQATLAYDRAFADADQVIIPTLTKLKINETDPEPPFDGQTLQGIIAKTHPQTVFIENDNNVIEYIKNNTKKEDVVVFLGSHGFRGMIDELIDKVKGP